MQLKEQDKEYIKRILKRGKMSSRIQKRANGLLYVEMGKSYTEVSKLLQVRIATVSAWCKRYREEGLSGVLKDKPKSGRPPKIEGQAKAAITALACSRPPEGYSKWSLRLLSNKIVELGIVEEISHTEVGKILKKIS